MFLWAESGMIWGSRDVACVAMRGRLGHLAGHSATCFGLHTAIHTRGVGRTLFTGV